LTIWWQVPWKLLQVIVGQYRILPGVIFSETFVGTERWDQNLASGRYFGLFSQLKNSSVVRYIVALVRLTFWNNESFRRCWFPL
jgi:hypothetical protein